MAKRKVQQGPGLFDGDDEPAQVIGEPPPMKVWATLEALDAAELQWPPGCTCGAVLHRAGRWRAGCPAEAEHVRRRDVAHAGPPEPSAPPPALMDVRSGDAIKVDFAPDAANGFAYCRTPAERSAAGVPLPDRSRWTYMGEVVEVRGTSPLMVWFTRVGESQLAQRTVFRHEFLKKAERCAS